MFFQLWAFRERPCFDFSTAICGRKTCAYIFCARQVLVSPHRIRFRRRAQGFKQQRFLGSMKMQKKPNLYVRFDRKNETGRYMGYRFSSNLELIKKDKALPSPKTRPISKRSNAPVKSVFDNITIDFKNTIQKLYTTMNTATRMIPIALEVELNSGLASYCSEHGDAVDATPKSTIYRMDQSRYSEIMKRHKRFVALKSGRELLPELFLLGLVSAYDGFLSELIRSMFVVKEELLSSSDKKLSYGEFAAMGSFEAARNFIIEKEVETVLRQSHADHFEWLERKLGIPLRKDLQIWPAFIELCERRNLITHTAGIVSSQYIDVCKAHKADVNGISVGDHVKITKDYMNQSVSLIEELGVKLIQVIWRKLLPDDFEAASDSLNSVGYDLIVERRYEMARTLLEFGLSLKNTGPDAVRRRMAVNAANSCKLSGKLPEAKEILNKFDWSASGADFNICIAAINDDVDAVCKLMPAVIGADTVTKDDFREWPVFETMRSNERFIAEFAKHFKEPFVVTRADAERGAESEGTALEQADESAPDDPTEAS
jgi:hypothetical protein